MGHPAPSLCCWVGSLRLHIPGALLCVPFLKRAERQASRLLLLGRKYQHPSSKGQVLLSGSLSYLLLQLRDGPLHLYTNRGLSRAGTGQDTSCSTVASLPQGAVYPLTSHPGSSWSGDAPAQFSETLMGQTLCPWLSAHQTMVETRQRNYLPRVSYLWESHETHVPCISDFVLPTVPSFKKNAIPRIVYQRVALEILIPFYSLYSHSRN